MDINPLDAARLRERIQESLDAFVAHRRGLMSEVSPDTLPLVDSLQGLLAGGKRLRPAFAYWGYRAAGGQDSDGLVQACSSLELLQACALIHDDVMDASDTRRGKPSIHKQFEVMHDSNSWSGSSQLFGEGAAILVGDLALSWADEMLLTCDLPPDQITRAKLIYDLMRTELMSGQYLDLLEQVRGGITQDRAEVVIRYKSAKYTIERPLHMGAVIAGADAKLLASLSRYGLALGEAFQLRDDLLGVFGNAVVTGKPAGDDLREGKQTMLIAHATSSASEPDRKFLLTHLGSASIAEATIAKLQTILIECGSQDFIEERIAAGLAAAMSALSEITDQESNSALAALAILATNRTA